MRLQWRLWLQLTALWAMLQTPISMPWLLSARGRQMSLLELAVSQVGRCCKWTATASARQKLHQGSALNADGIGTPRLDGFLNCRFRSATACSNWRGFANGATTTAAVQ